MNLNILIEQKLLQKNMSKQALYKRISEVFYENSDIKQISYPSFLTRLAENKLSAIDFFEIAEILDIDSREIQNIVHDKVSKNANKLPTHIKGIIKNESLFYRDSLEYEMINLGNGSKYDYYKTYLLCIDKSKRIVTLELFDFLSLTITLIDKINYKSSHFEDSDFENFLNLSGVDKINKIEQINETSNLIYKTKDDCKLIRKLKIPKIEWELNYLYTDKKDLEAIIKSGYNKATDFESLMKEFELKIKSDIISFIEGPNASVNLDGVIVNFDVVNSASYYKNDTLNVVYNIKIKSLEK